MLIVFVGGICSGLFLISPLILTVLQIHLWLQMIQKSGEWSGPVSCSHRFTVLQQLKYISESLHVSIESAPQLLIQLYILFSSPWQGATYTFALQLFSILSSLFSVVLICTDFSWETYLEQSKKIVLFISHVLVIAARVLAISLFASLYRGWVFLFMGIHLLLSGVPIGVLSYNEYSVEEAQGTDVIVKALMLLFKDFVCPDLAYMTPYSILRFPIWAYPLYYCIIYMENTVLLLLWYFRTHNPTDTVVDLLTTAILPTTDANFTVTPTSSLIGSEVPLPDWLDELALVTVLGLFWVGVVLLVVFYFCCYPYRHLVIDKRKLDFEAWCSCCYSTKWAPAQSDPQV